MERVWKRKVAEDSRDEGEDIRSRISPQSDNELEQLHERKKQRAKLNFSIESIMRSEFTKIEQPKLQQDSNRDRQQINDNDDDDNDDDVDDDDDGNNNNHNNNHNNTPSLSPTCSTNSSLDSDVEVEHLAPKNQVQQQQQQKQQQQQQPQQRQQQQNHAKSNNNQQQKSGKKSSSSSSSSGSTWSKERSGSGSNNSTNHLLKPKICHEPRLAPFECHLDNLDLWHRFDQLDTEMIITKQGRRMFPPVRVTFSLNEGRDGCQQSGNGNGNVNATNNTIGSSPLQQLNPRDKYQVLMDILPYDNKRYRYAYHKSSWQQAGKADPPSSTRLFLHPDGPFTLDQLKRQVISFEKIKLTNNDANKHGFIVLNSMHKYQPRIHLVLWRGKESQNLANAPISHLEQEQHKTFIFSETIFTAVTAYQNHSITKLKIDSNPFAKGFRDSSRLTDLELESMQDLMSDGQCPFSPPRAPPHGFPHFLFAAASSQAGSMPPSSGITSIAGGGGGGAPSLNRHHQMEDPASALLRERTIMALDSFLQQQHQQYLQQQHVVTSSASPHQSSGAKPTEMLSPTTFNMAPTSQANCCEPLICNNGNPSYLTNSSQNISNSNSNSNNVNNNHHVGGTINNDQHYAAAAAAAAATAAAAAAGLHPQHLQAVMAAHQQHLQAVMAAAHHQQQMAALSIQHQSNQPTKIKPTINDHQPPGTNHHINS